MVFLSYGNVDMIYPLKQFSLTLFIVSYSMWTSLGQENIVYKLCTFEGNNPSDKGGSVVCPATDVIDPERLNCPGWKNRAERLEL